MRQNPFFQSDDVHFGKLQAFGAVHCHQGDRIFLQLFFLFVFGVLFAQQQFVEEIVQALACALTVRILPSALTICSTTAQRDSRSSGSV